MEKRTTFSCIGKANIVLIVTSNFSSFCNQWWLHNCCTIWARGHISVRDDKKMGSLVMWKVRAYVCVYTLRTWQFCLHSPPLEVASHSSTFPWLRIWLHVICAWLNKWNVQQCGISLKDHLQSQRDSPSVSTAQETTYCRIVNLPSRVMTIVTELNFRRNG